MKEAAQREQIVETALAKFRRYGIRRVTLEEIARELRISKKTLYQHFDNKEAMVRACTDRISGDILPNLMQALQNSGTVSEKLAGVWQVFSRVPQLITPELIADIKSDYPHLWEEIDARRKVGIAGMESLLEEGLRTGEVRPEVHSKVTMRLIFAALENIMIPDVLSLGEFTPQQAVDTLMTILMRGAFMPARKKRTVKKGRSK
jgi:AcrR family transcriptional regulator